MTFACLTGMSSLPTCSGFTLERSQSQSFISILWWMVISSSSNVQLTECERAAIHESRKHTPRPIREEYGLHLVPQVSLELVTGCLPDSRRDLKSSTVSTEPPRQMQKGWGMTSNSPHELQPSLYPGQERLEARN